ncbi:MAG: FecCD family ABC transporter permease [Heliomarina sp.]|uniref:FecCD family ABC transporter permease n=1 Tax=Heliomarina sp. TaxID=2917556 RepID=UPI0040584B24
MSTASQTALADQLAQMRQQRARSRSRVVTTICGAVLAGFAVTLCLGQSLTPPIDVLRVLAGSDVPGASFTVGTLRLPRALVSILAGMSFGLGGVVVQTMLRNPLASPDIIGISTGASAAAVFAIVMLGWSGVAVSVVAVLAGLGVALLIYMLAWRDGVTGTRLILVGIGLSAMLESFIAYVLSRAPSWSLQDALRWLTGSVNGATLGQAFPVLASLTVFGSLLLTRQRAIEAMRLGDDSAIALGVPVARDRAIVILSAVGLIAVATAVSGPIAFVAFLSGPIALRIIGSGKSPFVAAALIGALLVLIGDYVGQHLLPGRYPVGVVTGALGAPYLIYLIARSNKSGEGK